MIIKDIKLSGFKSFNSNTGLDLTKITSENILVIRGENKNFLFESLLGIIFGFSTEEKMKFRDKASLVFTGRASLKFSDYTLHIERDFETDIIAVLSEGAKKEWLYQGRDKCNDYMARPYLSFLEKYFSIYEKSILLDLYKKQFNNPKNTFAEILDLLYLFLRPKLKLQAIRSLIVSCMDVLEKGKINEDDTFYKNDYKEALSKLHLLKNSRKITESKDSIQRDIKRLQKYSAILNHSFVNKHILNLKQRFPLIYHLNAYQLKKDVTFLNALQSRRKKLFEEVQKLRDKVLNIENNNKKLAVYFKLPDSFVDDFENYQRLSIDSAKMQNEFDKIGIQLGEREEDLIRLKHKQSISVSIALIIVAAIMVIFPEYYLGVGIAAILGLLTFVPILRTKKTILIEEIFNSQLEQQKLKNKIKLINQETSKLRDESHLIDDLDFIDSHISNFKKVKKSKSELPLLNREINILKQRTQSEKFIKTLPILEKQYKDLINLNPPEGLEKYIEEFAKTQKEAIQAKKDNIVNQENDPLTKIIIEYKALFKDLQNTQNYIEHFLEVDEIGNDIETKISQIERIIQHLQKRVHLEVP